MKRRIRIIGYDEVLKRLKAGEEINWLGGADFHAYFDTNETIRYDTLVKLWKQGLITDWGFPLLHGTIKYKPPKEAGGLNEIPRSGVSGKPNPI